MNEWVAGKVDGLAITRPFLLAAAAMMEVPIAMTLLARVLFFASIEIPTTLAIAVLAYRWPTAEQE
ncbi:MAG: hypothetical protein KIT84_16740 [Labilithrix sp.]|nr:hypothetical protein [Labilithrix sp.]MCW5812679.1 hypothetical protein [Labilithrix sp.]